MFLHEVIVEIHAPAWFVIRLDESVFDLEDICDEFSVKALFSRFVLEECRVVCAHAEVNVDAVSQCAERVVR